MNSLSAYAVPSGCRSYKSLRNGHTPCRSYARLFSTLHSSAWCLRCRRMTGSKLHRFARQLHLTVAALLLLAVASVTMAQNIEGRVIGITDGDTFTLLTPDLREVKVRVAEIDAPERGQPYATRSRQQLAELIFQKEVTVEVQVVDRYGRPVGRPIVDRRCALFAADRPVLLTRIALAAC